MTDKKVFKKLRSLTLIPLGIFLVYFSSGRPDLVEKYFAMGAYPLIGGTISSITGIFPFSAAEIIVILIPAAFVVYTIGTVIRIFSHRSINLMPLLKYASNLLIMVSLTFFAFLITWGLNYYRMPFADIAGMKLEPASASELESLCDSLINRANELRSSVDTDPEGNMDIPGSSRDILNNCYKGYDAIAGRYTFLGGSYGNPKPVFLSELMNYTGICGVYFPFTGEANVNISIPDSTLPSSALHEMAHQRGFSREDEANYISYLACTSHPDVNYKYSGILLALINSMNALYKSDYDSFVRLRENYSEGVRHDLEQLNKFWEKYEGPAERTFDRINDTYLKANNQKDGVQSYGRMVDLLIAERR